MICRIPIAYVLGALLVVAGAPTARAEGCTEGTQAEPARVIEACDALLAAPSTVEARLAGLFVVRAEALAKQGRVRPAIEDLGRAIARRPDHHEALMRRAELQQAAGEAAAAIEDYGRVLRLKPRNVQALLARAELYRARADRRRALADYAAVLRLEPAHAIAGAHHKALALEIERQGAMMPLQGSAR